MKLYRAVMFIALLPISTLAQESSVRSEAGSNPCVAWSTSTGLDSSQSGKAEVEFFHREAHPLKSRCNVMSFARPETTSGENPLSNESRDLAQRGESFSFESRAKSRSAAAALAVRSSVRTQTPPNGAAEAQELAKKLSNPVASLISFPLQSNFDFGMGTGSGWRYTLNVQPVIPVALSPKWNMISRTIIPIIHQGNVTGPNSSQTGLGDIVQSLFFSPNKSEPFVWAVGPVALIPTATSASLGGQKWGLGPTILVLKQKSGWTYGVLGNHIWSVAGKANRNDVNATFVQPFLSYTNKQAWTYGLNTESTYDWKSHSWATPIIPSVSKLVRFGKQPVSFSGGVKCWITTPSGGPEGCSLRVAVTALFPK